MPPHCRKLSSISLVMTVTTVTLWCLGLYTLVVQNQQKHKQQQQPLVVWSFPVKPTNTVIRQHKLHNTKEQQLLLLFLASSSSSSDVLSTANAVVVGFEQDSTQQQEPVTQQQYNYSTIDGVKVFGRLAEKYIALDSSGGQCCYSGCSNCEYRLPGGGYIMADQSSSRPKWIPSYIQRNTNNKDHITKWSSSFFPTSSSSTTTTTTTSTTKAITKEEFITVLQQMEYSVPLGGPYVSVSTGSVLDNSTIQLVEYIFDTISKGSTTITPLRFSLRLKQLSNGDEGMTWQSFAKAFNIQ